MPITRNTVVTLDGFHCVVPGNHPPASPVCLANSYWCPLGPTPGRAWVLMLRRDLDRITSPGSDYHELVIETRSGGRVDGRVAFSKLLLVKSERLAGGKPNDPESLHLVKFADKRYLLQKFSDTGVQHFNLRGFAHVDDYLDGTEGNTWSSVVGVIWNTMSSLLGSFPGLPSEALIDNVPEDIGLIGINAWSALDTVLAKLGCTVAYDPIDDQFRIVALGSEQPGLAEALRGVEKYRDAEPFESNATRFPATIRVYFHNHLLSYGQERDTEHVNNWAVGNHSASIDVATGIEGAVTGTVLPLWDDLPRLHDENNVLENASELSTRATNRANSWVNDQQVSGQRRWEVLEGIVPAVRPGSEVKAVLWRAWGPDHDGTATEIITHPGLPKHISGGTTLPDGIVWHQPSEAENNFSPPDLSRRTFPNYPRVCQAVQVWDSPGTDAGTMIDPNTNGLIPGRVVRWVAGALTTLEDCWILPISLESVAGVPDTSQVVPLPHAGRFIARLSGAETFEGVTKPLYLVDDHQSSELFRFEVTDDKSFGENVIGKLVEWTGAAYAQTGDTIGIVDSLLAYGPSETGAGGWCVRMKDREKVTISSTEYDAYEIVDMRSLARYVFFTLLEDMGAITADEASAVSDQYWGSPSHGDPPQTTIIVTDTQQQFSDCPSGSQGLAVLIENTDIYTIVTCGKHNELFRFEVVTSAKSYGADATAKLVEWNGAAYAQVGADVTLVDHMGIFGQSSVGASGWCSLMKDRPGVYEIVFMEGESRHILFTLTGTFTGDPSEASATVDDSWGAPSHGLTPDSSVTIRDTQEIYGDAAIDDEGLAVYIEDDDVYEVVRLGDPGKVKLESGGDLKYLKDHFIVLNGTPQYDSGDDLAVEAEVESDQLRLFIDLSAISGWNATQTQVLTHDTSGTPKWIEYEDCP